MVRGLYVVGFRIGFLVRGEYMFVRVLFKVGFLNVKCLSISCYIFGYICYFVIKFNSFDFFVVFIGECLGVYVGGRVIFVKIFLF